MAITDRSLLDLGIKSSANDDDTLVSVVSNRASRLTLGYIKNLISQWNNLKNKPFDNVSSDDFTISTDSLSGSTTLKLSPTISNNSHSHDNKRYLDKISESNDGVLLYNNSPIGDWNTLTNKPFESFSGDDFVIDESNVVSVGTSIKNQLHTHDNKEVIDKFSADTNGNLLFNGQAVKADGIDFTALSGMLVQGDNITITPNTDSNTIIISATIPETGINFTELSSMLVQGENISIVTDESAQTITLNASGIDFTALSTAITTGTQNGITVTADTENSRFNFEVTGIPTIAIDSEGYWTINGERGSNPTKAQGEKGNDGISPTAVITDTGNGATITITDKNGTTAVEIYDGTDGVSPHIDSTTKHWFVGETDTGIVAEGVTTISTTSVTYTGTLSIDGWVGDTAPYTQDVEISGITPDLSPFIDLIVSDDMATSDEEISQWAYITKATTSDNIITFRCNKTKPTIELNFKVKVV